MVVEGRQFEALERRLDGARLWGLELDLRYRVAAATFETRPDRHPLGSAEDSRLQLLLYPVGRVVGALHERADEPPRPFPIERLVEVVSSFAGPTVTAPLFDAPEPDLGPTPSFAGTSSARDGWAHRFTVVLHGPQGRLLVITLTFDDMRVRTPAGEEVPPEVW
ncbi:MAG: hypothetical protein ABR592_07225 [Nitriliruptorales bacterium]